MEVVGNNAREGNEVSCYRSIDLLISSFEIMVGSCSSSFVFGCGGIALGGGGTLQVTGRNPMFSRPLYQSLLIKFHISKGERLQYIVISHQIRVCDTTMQNL